MIEILHAGAGGGLSSGPWAALVDDDGLIGFSVEAPAAHARYGDIHVAVLRSVDRMRGFGFAALAGGEDALIDLPRDGTKLAEGARLLVQVRREARGEKLARVAGRATLAGRHAALAIAGPVEAVTIERRGAAGPDVDGDREAGLLAAAGAAIRDRAAQAKGSQLIWHGRGCVADLLYRFPDFSPAAVRCDSRKATASLLQTLAADPVGEGIVIEHVPDRDWRFSPASIGDMLAEAMERRQTLSSGASLLIERGETLTAIDVNSGSASSVAGPERMAVDVNRDAADEIGRLVRLLNLSGNLVIDFVGMRSKTKVRELVDRLRAGFAGDPAQPWIGSMSPIGLVELSRRYLGPSLFDRVGDRREGGPQGA